MRAILGISLALVLSAPLISARGTPATTNRTPSRTKGTNGTFVLQERQQPVLQVPGGVEPFLEALDLRKDLPRARLLLTAVRALWETPEGTDPESDRKRAAAFDYLRSVDAPVKANSAPSADVVPAFIPPETWGVILPHLEVKASSTFAGILFNRRAALLYHGIASLDPATREYLGSRPGLWLRLSEPDVVGVFATFGRCLRVREGRVVVPGGSTGLPQWEEVVGARGADPEEFILRVLSRDKGRLALLYDGIAHLDEGMRDFALGAQLPADRRTDRFRALYDAAGAMLKMWEPHKRPFQREPFDAVNLLLWTSIGPGGRLPGPSWPGLWKAVFNPLVPSPKSLEPRELEDDGPLDAARLVEWLCVTNVVERSARSETWLFAQRVFREVPIAAAPDLLLVLRNFEAYPALLLTLERMGVRDPAVYAAAVGAAALLADADRRQWQFQAAVAMVERARAARAIDVPTAGALVRKLSGLAPRDGAPFRGAIARWLEEDFLGAAGEPLVPSDLPSAGRPIETRVLAAMAGSVSSPTNKRVLALPRLEWEGLRYRIDPGQSALHRLVQVRKRQGGASLDEVLDVARLAARIAGARSSEVALDAARQLADAAVPLDRYASTAPAGGRTPVLPPLGALAQSTHNKARKLQAVPDAKALARLARPVQEAVDEHLAAIMGSLVYAAHLGDADSPALLDGDPSWRHSFRRTPSRFEPGVRASWQLPLEARDPVVGWRVTGALLCLDLALGELSLPRVPTDTMPAARDISDAERLAFADSALALAAFDMREPTRSALVEAIGRGRSRVEKPGLAPSDLERVAEDVELDEWRAQALPWTVVHDPGRLLALFSLAELARAGGLSPGSMEDLDEWGTAGFARGQAIAASYPVRLPWTTMAGRRAPRSSIAALVPDLVLGFAESSARLGLPAPLTAGLVLVASRDILESLHPAHTDDWLAMVACAQAVARGRLDDYVAAMTVGGPLVPEVDGTSHE